MLNNLFKKESKELSEKEKEQKKKEEKQMELDMKRAIEYNSESPLNFSYWHDPMVDLLNDSDFIKTIPSYVIPVTLRFFKVMYDGGINDELAREFYSLIPKEWLEKDEIFVRTGKFSDKFTFSNPHVKDVKADVLRAAINIAHTGLILGADEASEIALREFIPNKGNRPTIYSGMPLNTEFRYFYDFDEQKVLGVSNYWHPEVMKPNLLSKVDCGTGYKQDYEAYLSIEDKLVDEFNEDKKMIGKELETLLKKNSHFKGKWSVDIMKTGDEYYFIDMALMESSALIDQMEVW